MIRVVSSEEQTDDEELESSIRPLVLMNILVKAKSKKIFMFLSKQLKCEMRHFRPCPIIWTTRPW